MITWLPYPDFTESIAVLEMPELNRQKTDIIKILDIIHQNGSRYRGWEAHPAVSMWRGNEVTLCEYGLLTIEESFARGAVSDKQKLKIEMHMEWATVGEYKMDKPYWFGDTHLHISHQSNLIRHNPPVYGVKFSDVSMNLPYIWPVD